ncbi:MAG: hypothetical protein ACLT3R_00600 [Roseburia sp.]
MKKDKTLTELIVGIIFLGAVVQIIILIAFQNDLYNAPGLWSGIVIGIGMAVHMKHSIEDALDLERVRQSTFERLMRFVGRL